MVRQKYFWKRMKSLLSNKNLFFSKLMLVTNDVLQSNDFDLISVPNNFFTNVIFILNILQYEDESVNLNEYEDTVLKLNKKI